MQAEQRAQEAALQLQVKSERVSILFRHALLMQAMNLLVATSLVWFLWDTAAREALVGWWVLIVVIATVRIGLVMGYRSCQADPDVPWHTLMSVATACSGLIWGAAGVLFFIPDSAASLVFVTIVLAGMVAGSIPSHAAWPPAQWAYAVPTMAPIGMRYLLEGGELWFLGVMCFLYLGTMLVFGRQLSRTLVDSIRLRLENQQLVQKLREEMHAAEDARARAEEANLAKSKFLAAASHDLRQPLHAVNLFVEALRHERNPAQASSIVEHLGASAQSLEDLLNELLDISKLEAGLFEPRLETFELREVFEALERELRPVAEEKGIELGFVATRLRARSDPRMLVRVLRNIVTNAIRYTSRGAVLVGCRRRGQHVALAVYDTGPGIAPEHHEAIFREFYQLGNPERDRRKGLGLGLAIVDGLCRVLAHPLRLRSVVGRGSAFFVHVPIAAAEALRHEADTEAVFSDLGGRAVLVIDDEPAACLATKHVLERWGCRTLTAESGAEALARLSAEGFAPDAIVADYRLREGRTGAEAIAEIRRALARDIPATIVTGDTAPERLREARASGCLLLHKPLQPARLRVALASQLRSQAA